MTAANTSVETQGPFQVPCKKGDQSMLRGWVGKGPSQPWLPSWGNKNSGASYGPAPTP